MTFRVEGPDNFGEHGGSLDHMGQEGRSRQVLADSRAASLAAAAQQKQRRQMLIALGLLVVALIVVVIKDQQAWFASPPVTQQAADDTTEPPADQPAATDSSAGGAATTVTPAAPHAERLKHRAQAKAAPPVKAAGNEEQLAPGIVASNRAALPPLEVQVVAGGQPQAVRATTPSVHVDMQSGSAPAIPSAMASATQPAPASHGPVGAEVHMSPTIAQAVERPVEPNYPVLAKQMKVQGSVILQALIGREGSIQDLRVLSGPAILSTAAMDAVRQWHFRPYYQSGQPVETEARITVNFTISTY
jgi:periplasmic protein TonB